MTDKHQIENEMRVLKLNELTETLDIRLDQAQKDTGFYLAICQIEALQRTSFANRQPDPAFQASETPVFTSDLCKAYPFFFK